MGALYQRKKKNPVTGEWVEQEPWWIKYYDNGKPIRESTGTDDKTEARRRLKEKEGQVAQGLHQGTQVARTKFEDLVTGIEQDYALNDRKSARRLSHLLAHLTTSFGQMRAADHNGQDQGVCNEPREQGATNGTVNRFVGLFKADV